MFLCPIKGSLMNRLLGNGINLTVFFSFGLLNKLEVKIINKIELNLSSKLSECYVSKNCQRFGKTCVEKNPVRNSTALYG